MTRTIPLILACSALVACGGGSSGKERPTQATFTIEVTEQDPNGGKWDKYDSTGMPDIGMCVVTLTGTICYPDQNLLRSQCPDTTKCVFSNIPIPPEAFTVHVIDVDAVNNEDIGRGECDWDNSCTLGQAKVSIE